MKDVFNLKILFPTYNETYLKKYNYVGDRIILSVFTIFFCVVGLVGNGNVIWLLGFRIKRKPLAIFILNLAVADFGYLLVLLPLAVCFNPPTFEKYLDIPHVPFMVLVCLHQLMYTSSRLLLTALSVDRWVSVLFPNWYRRHRSQVISTTVCVLIWALSFGFNGVPLFQGFSGDFWPKKSTRQSHKPKRTMKDGFNLRTLFPIYNETYFKEYDYVGDRIILSIFAIFFCVVGLVGNGNVIWLLGFRIIRKPFAIFILNLAVADFGYLLFLLLLDICFNPPTFEEYFPTPRIPFLVLLCLHQLMYTSSRLLLTAMSMDRWVSVLFPNWYRRHRSRDFWAKKSNHQSHKPKRTMKDMFNLKALLSSYNETYLKKYNYIGDRIIVSIFTIFFCVVGLVGNGVVIWLLGFRIRMKPLATFILNLAVADFGSLLFLLPLTIDLNPPTFEAVKPPYFHDPHVRMRAIPSGCSSSKSSVMGVGQQGLRMEMEG
uniref:Uncharacterized protein n=1 Tax=Sphaerodactylus townsendi TaxID=933632 RepID=A0ACB8FEB1_9SAUR